MNPNATLLASQRVVQGCLLVLAAIALSGGALQMYLGQPETTPRLDNLIPELLLPVVITVAHLATNRHASRAVAA